MSIESLLWILPRFTYDFWSVTLTTVLILVVETLFLLRKNSSAVVCLFFALLSLVLIVD